MISYFECTTKTSKNIFITVNLTKTVDVVAAYFQSSLNSILREEMDFYADFF